LPQINVDKMVMNSVLQPRNSGRTHSFIHFFIATNVKTHSPLHMTKTYYDYVTR